MMETTSNTYRMPGQPEMPDMEGHLSEELCVTLTRREVYWLRDQIKKRIDSARQAMNDLKAHPHKKRARFEEFTFLRGIQDRLFGADPDGAEERAAFRADLRTQAEQLENKAAELRELAGTIAV